MDGRNISVVLMEQIIKGLDEIFCNVIIAVNKGDVRTGSDRRELYIDARDIQPDEDNKETTTSQTYLQKLADRGGEKLLAQLRTGSIEFDVDDDTLQVGDVLSTSLPQLGYTAMVRVADIITESQDSGTTRTLRLGTPTWHNT